MTDQPTIDLTDVKPLPIGSLTLGELAYFERKSGIPLSRFGDDDQPMIQPLMVLAGLALARHQQYPSWDAAQDAAANLTFEQAQLLIDMGDDSQGE